MKNIKAIVGLAALLTVTELAEGATVRFDPAERRGIAPGSTFSFDLLALGLPVGALGGSLDVTFDPNILAVTRVEFETINWEFDTRVVKTDNTSGRLEGISFTSFVGRSGDLKIATLSFLAKRAGVTPLGLAPSSVNPFADSNGTDYTSTVTFTGGLAQVVVPVPPSVLLMGSALIGLCHSTKRRRALFVSDQPTTIFRGHNSLL